MERYALYYDKRKINRIWLNPKVMLWDYSKVIKFCRRNIEELFSTTEDERCFS